MLNHILKGDIRHISYEDIDRDSYDQCLLGSDHFRIYASSWYLDAVAERWDLLVLDDYQAVMPLPRRYKFGLAYVYTPVFVQQLGVFSKGSISVDLERQFFKKAASKYFLFDYFTHSVPKGMDGISQRINYILSLEEQHIELQKKYNTNRKRSLKNSFEKLRVDKNGAQDLFLDHYRTMDQGFPVTNEMLVKLDRLIAASNQQIKIWNVFEKDTWIGGLVWVVDHKRVTYLVPVVSDQGRLKQASALLIDTLIQDHQKSGLILDFEGSMLPGVAQFYRSFGAEREIYYYFKKRGYGLL